MDDIYGLNTLNTVNGSPQLTRRSSIAHHFELATWSEHVIKKQLMGKGKKKKEDPLSKKSAGMGCNKKLSV